MNTLDAYAESFNKRGSKYDRAMKLVPDSRREEFVAVCEEISALETGIVLDVPAGGGYLKKYLPSRFTHMPHEQVSAFNNSSAESDANQALLPFPQTVASIDAVISVAGVHHFEFKKPVFEEMARVTKPGGQLVLADVHADSPVATFLDGYINANNSTGHNGYYLDEQVLEELKSCDWEIGSAIRKHYHWVFASPEQLAEYCHLLFDITHSDFERTLLQLESELGIDALDDGQVGLRWDLFVITANRSAP